MKAWQWILVGLFFGLLATGAILVIARTPRGEAVVLVPPPTPGPVTVHVSGAVKNPGVYELSRQSRVQDAIQAAGGLGDLALEDQINLAARIQDGQKIHIPAEGETVTAPMPETIDPEATGSLNGNRINLNSATLSELETLPEIGPSKAQNIITYRNEHGPFQQIEDIQNVPGIGEGIFQNIQDLITVD
ncbi:MAG TPA: helix-hairpin-helix domain-containing protein [Anaerolineaceae bacterium]|nr:helix-hairpin-helix domain-containing protein [Anaerolineaceae bacterium]